MYRWQIMSAVAEHGVVAIVRADTAERATDRARHCLEAGLSVLEVSLTTPDATEVVRTLRREHPDALVGAGTVLDAESAHAAVSAGAGFLVAPSLDEEVVRTGHRYGAAVVPGADTPTEIVRALSAGADAVKLFPARAWTPRLVRDVLEPLPQAPVIPTGGITVDDAPEWVAAGAVAVGMGSGLSAGTVEEVSERVTTLRERIRAARR
ncbi:bifunctional 4-hydroxy-2-oxoglutarate aldolase/2-dehydro-3-deoxy-phosphogluconate aldolase [Actinopolyspora mortivallis]|uniref:2-dehydro-3-deoxyphosphogluconate aldolase n=1 Tax=Actinopolyspora mortivallis TaxID=33906 RepID=A0A2T0GYV4_ACTMO|nr:bifunctional 4-hydroxy-2-oxoglutarate aldolase/2-dehydro-3-deoxy-phosphogluconate aldolase [Actinopolyspora mortivallis]PRW64277.1 2-dehydro-3-deoxyphosphogluconate aldolase [Actinopolyspora mortivallis]